MSVTRLITGSDSLIFDSAKIEQVGSQIGSLKLQNNPGQDFNIDFSSSAGFTFNASNTEFVGGQVRQIDQRPANAIFYASYSTDENADWSDDSGTGTLNNSAVINANGLDVSAGTTASCSYSGVNNVPRESGCIRLRNVRFNDSNNGYIISSGLNQEFYIRRSSATSIRCIIKNNSGGFAADFTASGLTLTNGVPYELELNWNQTGVGAGEAHFYIDGTRQSQDLTWNGDRSGTADTQLFIGAYSGSIAGFNGSIGSVLIFDTLQHSGASYTPDWSDIYETIYLGDIITTPELEYTGAGTLISFDSFTTVEGGAPRYTLQVGRSGDYLYWNGSAWVVSNNTYAQATDAATFNANAGSIDVNGEIYGQFRIYTDDGSTQASVDDLTASLTAQIYPTDDPTIQLDTSVNPITGDQLFNLIESVSKSGSDDIQYVLSRDGNPVYWDGAAWSTSDLSLVQSNTIAELLAGKASFLTEGNGAIIGVYWILHSDDGSTTPAALTLTIEYDFWLAPPTLTENIVAAYLYELSGVPSVKVLTVSTINYVIGTNSIIVSDPIDITVQSDGYFEAKLYIEDVEPDRLLWNFGGRTYTTNFVAGNIKFSELTVIEVGGV